MANCKNCPTEGECDNKENCLIEHNPDNSIGRIIGVMSGKGGVGKSSIAVLLAKELKQRGYAVGILDADITGPSIPRLTGVKDKRAGQNELGILPVVSEDGISVISINALIENESSPVIWRGPMISNTVKQFYTEVFWGDIDYLIIDLPPGTSDVALTVMQSIPISGMLIVGVAQDMVSMIVQKAINMVKTLNIKILGLVENFSYIECPDCGKQIRMFNANSSGESSVETDIELLGRLPVSAEISMIKENGINLSNENMKSIMAKIADSVVEATKK